MIYVEQENGYLVDEDGRTIPNSTSNRHWNQAQQEVIDMVSTITPYAGSDAELEKAVADKQAEVKAEFTSRHGIDLLTANYNKVYYQLTANPAAVKMDADIGAADVAIVFVGALLDLSSIDGFDVMVDVNWAV